MMRHAAWPRQQAAACWLLALLLALAPLPGADAQVVIGGLACPAVEVAVSGQAQLPDSGSLQARTYRLAAGTYTLSAALALSAEVSSACFVGPDASSAAPVVLKAAQGARHFLASGAASTRLGLRGVTLQGSGPSAAGGGIEVGSGSSLDAASVAFANCRWLEHGGALRLGPGSTTRLTGVRFTSNQAALGTNRQGGAVWVSGATARLEVNDSAWRTNGAGTGGALAVVGGAGAVSLAGRLCMALNNFAQYAGGAVFIDGASSVAFLGPAGDQNFGANTITGTSGLGPDIYIQDGASNFTCGPGSTPRRQRAGGYQLQGPVCGDACPADANSCTCPFGWDDATCSCMAPQRCSASSLPAAPSGSAWQAAAVCDDSLPGATCLARCVSPWAGSAWTSSCTTAGTWSQPANGSCAFTGNCSLACNYTSTGACVPDSTLASGWRCTRCASTFSVARTLGVCGCRKGSFGLGLAGGCQTCSEGSYCPGGEVTSAAPNVPPSIPCGEGLTTLGQGAMSQQQCVNRPGYRFVAAPSAGAPPSAVECGPGTYSLGLRQQRECTACPPGTDTQGLSRATGPGDCVPSGSALPDPLP